MTYQLIVQAVMNQCVMNNGAEPSHWQIRQKHEKKSIPKAHPDAWESRRSAVDRDKRVVH
jgi:hypothetical protein